MRPVSQPKTNAPRENRDGEKDGSSCEGDSDRRGEERSGGRDRDGEQHQGEREEKDSAGAGERPRNVLRETVPDSAEAPIDSHRDPVVGPESTDAKPGPL